jgi:hypothetical protein
VKNTIVSCPLSHSSGNRNVLVEFLIDESNNSKWLRYAQSRINKTALDSRVGSLTAEDYVSDIKVTILDIVSVAEAPESIPVFTMIRDGETVSMNREELLNYFFALLSLRLTNSFKREKHFVSMPYQDEVEDDEPGGENDNQNCKDNPGREFTVEFDDPFDESLDYLSKESIEEYCRILGDEDPLYRIVFEELLNGLHNREIAKKYKLPVRKIENIRKIINRRLNKPRG